MSILQHVSAHHMCHHQVVFLQNVQRTIPDYCDNYKESLMMAYVVRQKNIRELMCEEYIQCIQSWFYKLIIIQCTIPRISSV